MDFNQFILKQYNLKDVSSKKLDTPTNDIYIIDSHQGKYALKVYKRQKSEIEWEIELLQHLIQANVSVVKPLVGQDGFISELSINNINNACVLYDWANGLKTLDNEETYYRLGCVAAQIHQASDSFKTKYIREAYSSKYLITEQIEIMSSILKKIGRYDEMIDLKDKLMKYLENSSLDYGVCHMDLKPDNVHLYKNEVIVFDFDSASLSWRAIEPYRVLAISEIYFQKWLEGYREVRNFSKDDEKAVQLFTIIGDLRNTVWYLGLAKSSRGSPTIENEDLDKLINKWLKIGFFF